MKKTSDDAVSDIMKTAEKYIKNKATLQELLLLLPIMIATSERNSSLVAEKFWLMSIGIDFVLGMIHNGQRIHIAGPTSSGKTALLLDIVKHQQERKILFVDASYNLASSVLNGCGIDPNKCLNLRILHTNQIGLVLPTCAEYDIVMIDDIKSVVDLDNLPELMWLCKTSKTTIIAADQVRDNMQGGKVPGINRMVPLFESSLYISRSSIVQRDGNKIVLSRLKLINHRRDSRRLGKQVVIPFAPRGAILTSEIVKNIARMCSYDPRIKPEEIDAEAIRLMVEEGTA